jgi:hypothetical protein
MRTDRRAALQREVCAICGGTGIRDHAGGLSGPCALAVLSCSVWLAATLATFPTFRCGLSVVTVAVRSPCNTLVHALALSVEQGKERTNP